MADERKLLMDLKPYAELGSFGHRLEGAQVIWDDERKVGLLIEVKIKPDVETTLLITQTHEKSGPTGLIPVTGAPEHTITIEKRRVIESSRTGDGKYGPGVTYEVRWQPDPKHHTVHKVTVRTTPLEEEDKSAETSADSTPGATTTPTTG